MTGRIFRSIFFVALGVFLSSIVLFMWGLFDYFSNVQKKQLKMQTDLAAHGAENEGISYFDGLNTEDYRITWIDTDGTVLYDSETDSGSMENHLEREEIKQAFDEGIGESSRYSATLTQRSLYCAQRISDGTVVRLSVVQNTMFTLIIGMIQPICFIFMAALIISLVLASRLSKKIVKPLNDIDLDNPLNNNSYDELAPLLRRLNSQQEKIKQQYNELIRKQQEFETVTNGMNEGIVLLNSKGIILSINPAAQRLLSAKHSPVGDYVLSVNRSPKLREALLSSADGKYAEKNIELFGRIYQLNASPITYDDQICGTVLLFLDVTEKEKSEQIRREFTANVSHELKTPLQTISGYAELMANNMVKSGDICEFSERIYAESQRMIRLVEDIIKLSRLDEGAEDMRRENVDLYVIAQEVAESLLTEAESVGVNLVLEGGQAEINGIPHLLRGIVYNLCDNAVKYNHKGGSVKVSVNRRGGTVILSVADTGIGIPEEHRDRIFERFYRVDKSHSKEIGGTGLGLSIVKHAARLHNAAIELQTEVNKGTTITVIFPENQSKSGLQ